MYNILHQLQLEANQERAIHAVLQIKKFLVYVCVAAIQIFELHKYFLADLVWSVIANVFRHPYVLLEAEWSNLQNSVDFLVP